MNSQTSASFQFKKLSKSMDLKSQSLTKDSFRYTSKLASVNAINRSVKYNDLSFITGSQLCKLRRDPVESLQNPEFSSAQGNMFYIRKKFDKKNQEKLYIQNKTQRLRDQINKLKTLQDQILYNIKQGKNKVQNLQKSLEDKKVQLEIKQFEKKSMLQMISSIQHDKVIYSKKKYDMELYLKAVKFQQNSIKKNSMHNSEQANRTLKVYQKLIDKLDDQQKKRTQHIHSIQSMILSKQSVNNSTLLRKSQMGQIAERAMTDRSIQQKEWQKIYLSHKLLSNLLVSKMEKEMQKFNIVQDAFKNIKIATGVSDSKTLINKYLKKEQVYGNLLSKIAENQKIITELKIQKQKYLKEIKLNQQQIHLFQVKKVHHDNLSLQLKKAQQIEAKRKNCDFAQQKLREWLIKINKKIDKDHSVTQSKRTKKQLIQSFSDYLNLVKNLSQNCIENVEEDLINEQNFSSQNAELLFRVKPFTQVQGEYKPYFQQQEPSNISTKYFNEDEQNDSVQGHRQWILKSNDKFMKQIKRKREQAKQLLVQSLVKNNKDKVVLEKPKKVQPVPLD